MSSWNDVLARIRAYSEGDFNRDPAHYRLYQHRWHLLMPGVTDAPKGRVHPVQVAQKARERFEGAFAYGMRPGGMERLFGAWEAGDYKGAAQGNPDRAPAHARMHARYPSLTPDDVREAVAQAGQFYGHLIHAVMEGEHGQGPHGHHIGQMFAQMPVEPLDYHIDNAEFARLSVSAPQQVGKGYAMRFNPITLAAHHLALPAGDPTRDWYGHGHLMSAGSLVAHETAHALDWFVSHARAVEAGGGRLPDHHHSPGKAQPGLVTTQGLAFEGLSKGLQRYTQEEDGLLVIPTLPPPFTRLHYPMSFNGDRHKSGKIARAQWGDPMWHDDAVMRGARVCEWPTTLTELSMGDPSALAALDHVAGLPQGDTKARLDRFWGFSLGGEPDPARTAALSQGLGKVLERHEEPQRVFYPMKESSETVYPNPLWGSPIRSYAAGMDTGTNRWGHAPRPRTLEGAGQSVRPPLYPDAPRTPEHLRAVLADLARFGRQTPAVGYLTLQVPHDPSIGGELTGQRLREAIEDAYYGRVPLPAGALERLDTLDG